MITDSSAPFVRQQFDREQFGPLADMLSRNAAARLPGPSPLMPGDLAWRLPGSVPKDNLALFHDEVGLAGFAWYEPDTGFEFDLRAGLTECQPLLKAITDWAEERRTSMPVYEEALDIVLDTGSGFGAYCICWKDPLSRVGNFEPVGTHPDWRGGGVGRSVILEGLRRLQQHGMRYAQVSTAGFSQPAQALYESCGFERRDTARTFMKVIVSRPANSFNSD